MPYSMSQAAVPVFEIGLAALSNVLDKGAAFAAAKKVDPKVLAQLRLAPDMLPLTRQVQIACDQAKNGLSRLAGVEPPRFEDNEASLAELKSRIGKTLAVLAGLDAKAVDAGAEREIVFVRAGKKAKMIGANHLLHFVTPNFYFHLTTAYDILRYAGVAVGKADFLGDVPGFALV